RLLFRFLLGRGLDYPTEHDIFRRAESWISGGIVMKRAFGFIVAVVLISATVFAAQGQRGQRGAGQRGRGEPAGPPMDSTPKNFDTADYKIRVVTVAEGLAYPYSFAFLPDGSIVVSESDGRLRMIRDGKLLPEPIAQIPSVHFVAGRGGFMEIVL